MTNSKDCDPAADAKRIMAKYPDRVPLIVERAPRYFHLLKFQQYYFVFDRIFRVHFNIIFRLLTKIMRSEIKKTMRSNLPEIKRKFLVPVTMLFGGFRYVRKNKNMQK